MANLTVTLNSNDNLSGALEDVADAADRAVASLEKVEDSVSNIKDDMAGAATSASQLESKFDEVAQSGGLASSAASRVERSFQDLTLKASVLIPLLDNTSESMGSMIPPAMAAADSTDQLEEQTQELRNSLIQTEGAMGSEMLAALAMVGPNNLAAQSMDNVAEEADDARNSMAGAASMAELLSLQSSALSINVGAFTIALRNLTTQVPLLVASLGNLAAAFVGVGGAVGAIGVGGLAGVLGGAVAEVESISGEMASMEERMQAIQAIGEEFMSMLREAIEPLVEMEGAVGLFRGTLENLATTVRVFSQSIAESWENGPLRRAIGAISDAWMDSIVAIGNSFEYLMRVVGEDFADSIAAGIRQLDDFIVFAADVANEIGRIISAMRNDGAFKSFLQNMMALGRQIAGGLAPALGVFFDLTSRIAEELTKFNSETIGAVVQVIALGLAVNKLASIFANLAQPIALATGHLTEVVRNANSASGAFVRMSGRILKGTQGISSGFQSMSAAMQTAIPFMDPKRNNLEEMQEALRDTGGPIDILRGKFEGFGSSVSRRLSPITSTLYKVGDAIRGGLTIRIQNLSDKLANTRLSAVTKSIDKMRDSLARSKTTFKEQLGLTTKFNRVHSTLTGVMDKIAGKAIISANAQEEVSNAILQNAQASDMAQAEVDELAEELVGMVDDGELAGLTMDELSEEMNELTLSSQVAEESLEDVTRDMTEMSFKARLAALQTSLLSGVTGTLAITLGGLVAIIGAVVLAVGIAAAGLMALGSSGKDADEIITGMKETLSDLATAAMPFVVASGNMVIDIFNSIMFVAKELVTGFEEIGVAMGLIDPSDTESGGFVSSFENILNAMIPVIKATGDYARLLAGILGQAIADIMSILVQFVEAMHIAEIIAGTEAAISALTLGFLDFGGVMALTANIISTLISGIIKITAIAGILIGVIAAVTVAVMVLNLGLGTTLGLLIGITSPISLAAALILGLVAAVVLLLEKFGILDTILNGLMGLLKGIMGLFVGLAQAIGKGIAGVIDAIVSIWNETLGGMEVIPELDIPGIPRTPFNGFEYEGFSIPNLGGSGDGGSDGSGGGGGGPGPSDSDNDEDSILGGFDTLGGLGKAGKESMMGGSPSKVEYNEGDTRNNYQTEVNADPEEKGQMSRLVKDAMEEANSFRRQQEGHTR